ncbi:PKD domain-containing protein [Shewanella sp. KCT]|uniref:PKD domain-containing protein n=1 Tax=Shewanella sp. KCT TaxID=2569535 RepID=UPI001182A772|nr:hypothetical protein [Shewanella sp. KCT]TVP16342.1 hypothetical protein AYI87_02690 [Shewanella sp. KCT]
MTFKHQYLSSLIIASMMMTACGSSESDKEDIKAVNQKPTVSVAPSSFKEKAMATIAATASDPDGEITGYSWTVVSGHDLTLQNADSDTVSFTSPEVGLDGDIIELALTVTDDAGETATTNVQITINPNTIPLSFMGLATDAPLSNATISINVSGRNVGVETTTDAKGYYTVDLLLDDSEADSVVNIVAHGSGEQSNAGLISWLGTVEKLSQQAGDDKTLTAADNFAVNVTNITTAQYGLAMRLNKGEAIKDNETFDLLSSQLDFDDVLVLATAIKVAIDKSNENHSLALPDGVSDTLALIDDEITTNDYISQVQSTPEYAEAQQEMFNDETLIDTASDYSVPSVYYVSPADNHLYGDIYQFGTDGKGSIGNEDFEWIMENGTITATVSNPNVVSYYNYVEVNDVGTKALVEHSITKHELKRVSSNSINDSLLITYYHTYHYPNGELEDLIEPEQILRIASKESSVQPIQINSLDTAYVTTPYNQISQTVMSWTETLTLNDDTTGTLRFSDKPFTWQDSEGVLQLNFTDGSKTRFKKIQTGNTLDLFALETSEDGSNFRGYAVGRGKIVTKDKLPSWNSDTAAGIYQFARSPFTDSLYQTWYELHENGDAEIILTSDDDEDGKLSTYEITIMYGNWQILEDGSLTLQLFLDKDVGPSPNCRSSLIANCKLYRDLNWKLIAQKSNEFGLLNTYYSPYGDGLHTYAIRPMRKLDIAPINLSQIVQSDAGTIKSALSDVRMHTKLSHQEQPR